MKRGALILAALLAALAVLAFLVNRQLPKSASIDSEHELVEPLPTPTAAPLDRITLLFPDWSGLLSPELREVRLPAELEERVVVIIEELLAGPANPDQQALVPWECELRAVWIDGDRAFVDLSGPPRPVGGSKTELLLTYGVVDSIILNTQQLRAVQLLFDGSEQSSLSGHLDLSRPLELNTDLISR